MRSKRWAARVQLSAIRRRLLTRGPLIMPEDMQQFLQRKHLEAQARMRRLEEIRRQPKRPPTHKDAVPPGEEPDSTQSAESEKKTTNAPTEPSDKLKRPQSESRKVRVGSRVFRPSTIARRITSMAEEIRRVNEEARKIKEDVTGESSALPKRVDASEEDVRKKQREAELRKLREQNASPKKPTERNS